MAALQFFKRTTLPGTLVANAFYYIANGSYSESYVTDNAGVAKAIGNSTMINALIDTKLNAYSTLQHVATIAARNTAGSSAANNTMFLVTDATGDATVNSGAALYFYDKSNTTYTKVAEYESMDVVLQWANIQGKPTSTVAAIDTAVGQAHTHSNKTTLDLLTDVAGALNYNGSAVSASWNATDW